MSNLSLNVKYSQVTLDSLATTSSKGVRPLEEVACLIPQSCHFFHELSIHFQKLCKSITC